jgi:hypothetical protein
MSARGGEGQALLLHLHGDASGDGSRPRLPLAEFDRDRDRKHRHEIAGAENINPSYVSRVLRLTLLAPEVVEALITALAADAQSLDRLMKPFPVECQMHGSLFDRLRSRLERLASDRSPIPSLKRRDARWVVPEVTVLVRHLKGSGVVRHATVKSLVE